MRLINPFTLTNIYFDFVKSYMEEHLNDKNRLGKEWKELENYEPDQNKVDVGCLANNMTKNRYSNIIPCTLK